jgi:hypothetical protein
MPILIRAFSLSLSLLPGAITFLAAASSIACAALTFACAASSTPAPHYLLTSTGEKRFAPLHFRVFRVFRGLSICNRAFPVNCLNLDLQDKRMHGMTDEG